MHYLILFPYYFFTALTLAIALSIITRTLRLKLSINAIMLTSVLVSLAGYMIMIASPQFSIDHFTGKPMAAIGVASFVLATLDTVLKRALPHAIDEELAADA